jgi:DNA-binding response OmpR family regulator
MQSCIGRGTILIVEDEQLMLRLVAKVLLQHGYQAWWHPMVKRQSKSIAVTS